jgi:hypothetical protein
VSFTKRQPLRQAQRRLIEFFHRLDETDRASLLAFAEFLASRRALAEGLRKPKQVPEPRAIARPDGESVVAAIRRLSASYYMLDRGPLLHEASSLMAAHVMQGRPAVTVIDELETLFAETYKKFLEQNAS